MRSETRGDMKYSGLMTMPGGSYERISLDGVITIDGDLDCDEIRTNGMITCTGKVKSKRGKLNGTASIKGRLESDELDSNGDLKVEDGMAVHELRIEGRIYVKGNVASENIDMKGEININGNCDAEALDCKGAFKIDGTLNAGDVDVDMYAPCRAKEIGGEKIRIHKGRKSIGVLTALFTPLIFGKTHLTVDMIEGDEISIDHTTAKVVRGGKVTIGDGCVVDLVEYRDNFEKASGARIKKYVKV